MKLLFLTQVLDANDAVLGFVPRWVEGLADRCEAVRVVALEVGDVAGLPANVDYREVGRRGVVGRYLRYRRILAEALKRDGFDAVLAHMVPRYALVARGPARSAGAGLFLWYTHKGVDERLRRAVRQVDKVFTASEESLRIESPNRVVTGHGIDLKHFCALASGASAEAPSAGPSRVAGALSAAAADAAPGRARLLAVGRLTPAKDPLTVLAALSILVSRGFDVELDLVGGALASGDDAYMRRVHEQIEVGNLADRVRLHGPVPYRDVPQHFRAATISVTASYTRSVDKVVLEAMATGVPVVTCTESFPPIFEPLNEWAERSLFEAGNAAELADRLEYLLLLKPSERAKLGQRLRAIVERDHEVDTLMARLVSEMGGASDAGAAG